MTRAQDCERIAVAQKPHGRGEVRLGPVGHELVEVEDGIEARTDPTIGLGAPTGEEG